MVPVVLSQICSGTPWGHSRAAGGTFTTFIYQVSGVRIPTYGRSISRKQTILEPSNIVLSIREPRDIVEIDTLKYHSDFDTIPPLWIVLWSR